MEANGGKKVDWDDGGPARAAARPLSFAEALLNEVEPGFNPPMRRWRGGLQALRGTRRPYKQQGTSVTLFDDFSVLHIAWNLMMEGEAHAHF